MALTFGQIDVLIYLTACERKLSMIPCAWRDLSILLQTHRNEGTSLKGLDKSSLLTFGQE